MTVQELIDRLSEVEDKSRTVVARNRDGKWTEVWDAGTMNGQFTAQNPESKLRDFNSTLEDAELVLAICASH